LEPLSFEEALEALVAVKPAVEQEELSDSDPGAEHT
jgi:hypothetical protein